MGFEQPRTALTITVGWEAKPVYLASEAPAQEGNQLPRGRTSTGSTIQPLAGREEKEGEKQKDDGSPQDSIITPRARVMTAGGLCVPHEVFERKTCKQSKMLAEKPMPDTVIASARALISTK